MPFWATVAEFDDKLSPFPVTVVAGVDRTFLLCQTYRQTDRQTQTCPERSVTVIPVRQTDRQTERHTDRQTETCPERSVTVIPVNDITS